MVNLVERAMACLRVFRRNHVFSSVFVASRVVMAADLVENVGCYDARVR
jgi:hypothetical protein